MNYANINSGRSAKPARPICAASWAACLVPTGGLAPYGSHISPLYTAADWCAASLHQAVPFVSYMRIM